MEFADPFSAPGNWYKGQLHTHTTQSDGMLEPTEVLARYCTAGYDFVALTDHNTVTEVPQADAGGLLALLGVEMDGDRGRAAESVHVVAVGLERAEAPPERPTVPQAIAWTRAHGGEALIAHPYWSGLVADDILQWDGDLGVEVFNAGCHFELAKGHSTVHWDDLLGRGRRTWGFAVDDSHHRRSPDHPVDTAKAWVMVKVESLTREALLGALREGLFYSSWGPEIRRIALEGDEILVSTSPVTEISFIAQRWAGRSVFAPEGEALTQASHRLRGHEDYVRVECRDARGRCAWSNPLFP